jgi:hypothetical protein
VTVHKGAPNFEHLVGALQREAWDEIPQYLTVAKTVASWSKGDFVIDENRVLYKGQDLPANITQRILEMAGEGKDPTIMFNFWKRLNRNPSYRATQQLWNFLKNTGIPLTPDGCFLAYKSVRSDYYDFHSRSFLNKPGCVNEMPRNQISDDQNVSCAEGFHVGAMGYVGEFGTSERRVVVCKVDPEHVVSVPQDYNSQKMRVCKYVVVGNYGSQLPDTVFAEDEEETKKVASIPDEKPKEKTDRKLETKKVGEATNKIPRKKSKDPEFRYLDKKNLKELMEESLDTLRQYAFKGLQIVGASKIPGGKSALVSAILETRDGAVVEP